MSLKLVQYLQMAMKIQMGNRDESLWVCQVWETPLSDI